MVEESGSHKIRVALIIGRGFLFFAYSTILLIDIGV